MKVLLTGSTGFIGNALSSVLDNKCGVDLTCTVRAMCSRIPGRVLTTGEIDEQTDWATAVVDQNLVIHTAARAHDFSKISLADYRRVNVNGTLNLARQAAEAGVNRFIFLSSIKVNGERTLPGKPFTENDESNPEDACGISKLEAEKGLLELSRDTGMEVVIIRPPLVYGLGVKGNFAILNKLVSRGIPLPLGAIHNQRSFVALGNLVDLIVACLEHPAAANQVFLAGDGQDVSTTDLLREVAAAMGKSPRLIPVSEGLLMFGAGLIGKRAVAQRVLGSLQVDISKARRLLGWNPPLSLQEGLRQCFREESGQ